MRRAALLAVGLLGLLALGACSHSGPSSAGAENGAADAVRAGSHGGAVNGAAPVAPPSPDRAEAASRPDAAVNAVVAESGEKIRTAQMTVAVTGAANVSGKADQAGAIALGASGEVDA